MSRPPKSGPAVVRLVVRREVQERLRAKSFYISTGLLVAVIIGVGFVSRLAGDSDPGTTEIGITAPAPAGLAAAVAQSAQAFGREASVSDFDTSEAARVALSEGDIDAAVVVAERQVVFEGDVDAQVLAIVQQAWAAVETRRALADAGLDQGEITAALEVPPLEAVSADGDGGDSGLAALTGTMAAVLLFLSLQTFGNYVLTGVVEEKATAVVEVLLVRAGADQLLAGKVIGIGVAALTQFTLAIAAGVVALSISGVDVPSEVWSALPMTIVWFLGGYALYSTLFALAGSLVSRQEDAQSAAAPIMYSLVSAYLLVFVFGYEAESTVSRVLSMVPPIAPLLMPVRMAAGAASTIEVVVALVLLAATIVVVWKLAGRIYEQVLLRRGSRVAWRDAKALVRRG